MIQHLLEPEVRAEPERLARAWQAEESMSIVPVRQGVEASWIRERADLLPDALHRGCVLLTTSGSTGTPKVIVGSKTRAEALARALHCLQQSEPVQSTIVALPLSYCYAFVNQWLWAHLHGRELVMTDGLADPAGLRTALERARDAMLCLVGPQVDLLLRHFADHTFVGVIRLHFAGGPFPTSRLPALARMFPSARIFNNFGCAEAMPRLSLRPADPALPSSHVGRPLPGVRIRTGAEGELLFRSPYQMLASIDDEGLSLIGDEDWIPSGDLGGLAPDGSLHLRGRASQVFKRFGEKISLPGLLDTISSAWDGEAAFYVEHADGEEPAHVLVLAPVPDRSALRPVLVSLRKGYARPHWPVRIEGLPHLPRLENGKLDLEALRDHNGRTELWRQRL